MTMQLAFETLSPDAARLASRDRFAMVARLPRRASDPHVERRAARPARAAGHGPRGVDDLLTAALMVAITAVAALMIDASFAPAAAVVQVAAVAPTAGFAVEP